MALGLNYSVRLVGEISPIVTKAMLINLVENGKIKEDDMLNIFQKFDILKVINIPKEKEKEANEMG